MAARPPLPFGLGRDPTCSPHRCLSPGTPLPAPGSPLHDQVAQALSQLFQTFFSTSLRYLGVSEVLDWVESSGTIDAWILTGLEQGRQPEEVGNIKNLEFGREAIKQVVKNALDAEEEAWATSLRETGFSSSVSMVYEGIVAQLKPGKTAPLPCLHTLLTPTGLSMLKSAPLKSAFPICPPRTPPSCSPLLASIRSLITSGLLTGPAWKTPSVWRAAIRKAFAAYHTLLREIAEELVSARSFAQEYYIFLENISQPIQLLQLITDDFEVEFGTGATRGLLGVGDAGGDNLISIMNFCAARKPSELLARVKQRVAEKQEREKRAKEVEVKRARLKELDARIRVLLLEYRSKGAAARIGAGIDAGEDVSLPSSSSHSSSAPSASTPSPAPPPPVPTEDPETTLQAALLLQRDLESTLDERDAVKAEVEALQAREEEDERTRRRERAEKEKALAAVGVKVEGGRLKATTPAALATSPPAAGRTKTAAVPPPPAVAPATPTCIVGPSKDLYRLEPQGPFATNAPRVPKAQAGSTKGKARAANQASKSRGASRYAPPPPSNRYNRLRDFSPAPPSSSHAAVDTPLSSRASSPAPSAASSSRPRRAPAPPSSTSSTPSSSRAPRQKKPKAPGSRLRPRSPSPAASSSTGPVSVSASADAASDDGCCCALCCPLCAREAELARAKEMVAQTQRARDRRKGELRGALGLLSAASGMGLEVEVRDERTPFGVGAEEEEEEILTEEEGEEEGILSEEEEEYEDDEAWEDEEDDEPVSGEVLRIRRLRAGSASSMPGLVDLALPGAAEQIGVRRGRSSSTGSMPDLVPLRQEGQGQEQAVEDSDDDSLPDLVPLSTRRDEPETKEEDSDSLPDLEPLARRPTAIEEDTDSMPDLEELPTRSITPAPAKDADEDSLPDLVPLASGHQEHADDDADSLPDLEPIRQPQKQQKRAQPPPQHDSDADSMPDLEPLRSAQHAEDDDDPPEVALEPVIPSPVQPQKPLAETTNTASAATGDGSKKKKKKKKKAKKPHQQQHNQQQQQQTGTEDFPPLVDPFRAPPAGAAAQSFTPLSRYPPPKCCPPHWCTGVGPNYAVWQELDSLLYETCLAGFKYELIGALPSALHRVRDSMAKSYLLAGGRMTTDANEPKEMDSYLAIAEQRGLWHSVHYPEVQAWGQRVLAISLQKLVDVLRATLGDICICKMSQHLEILREARQRLSSCEQLDRQIPIDLAEMDHQEFMLWAHGQLREKKLSGPEWQSSSRQYLVQDFLLSFSDAFDAAMDRLVLRDPLLLAEDVSTLLEWQGGVRTFETALRLAAKDREGIVIEFGTGIELLEGTEEGPVEKRPLQAWGRLLELSAEARSNGTPFSRDLAEQEKQRGNEYFAGGEYEKAIVAFTTASIIFPLEPTFTSNAAAARMKLGTAAQYSEAICDCTLALFHDHRNIKALYRRGMALALTGYWKAAFADLRTLDRIAPDCQPAKEALAWANERYAALKASKAVK